MKVAAPALVIRAPAGPLRAVVSHYWLSRDNQDPTYEVLPDGAVDLVVEVNGAHASSRLYGTTTAPTDVVLTPHSQYLGIRFRPGQSRHFIKPTAHELTDASAAAPGLLRFALDAAPEKLSEADLFAYLDALLERHLARCQPQRERLDAAIDLIERHRGTLRVAQVAESFGTSRRHFERVFLETVGVSAKFFSLIARFRCASALIAAPGRTPLAAAAAEAGYTDQSHMTRDFKRLAGVSPARFARDVAFVQESR
jgi:AraC-like DNA-binding protein